jgi:hypothetical protein
MEDQRPRTEDLFELMGDDLYLAGVSIRDYVINNEVSKEQAYDLAKIGSNLAWMRGMRNSMAMGESLLKEEMEAYKIYYDRIENTPGLVDHMLNAVQDYKDDLFKRDPEAWWNQYGRNLIKTK